MITVLIPTWQRIDDTKRLIESLEASNKPFELICDDDGSDSEVIEFLKTKADILITHKNKRPLTSAWNNGIKIAKGSHVFIVNNDLVVSENWQDLATDHIITAPNLVSNLHDVKPMPFSTQQRAISGCAMMINKEKLLKLGLFDESLEFYFSDWDMNHRLSQDNNLPIVIKSVTALHKEGERREEWFKRDQQIFNNKYPNGTIYSSM